MKIKDISSPTYTAEIGDTILKVNAASGAVTITLPPSLGFGEITVRKVEASDYAVRISTSGSDTIDGLAYHYLRAKNAFVTLAPVTGGWTIVDKPSVVHFHIPAASATAASTTGIHAAITDTGEAQAVTTGITQPSVPRNLTATAGGTEGDIKAIQVTVTGTNYLDEVISEALPAFTANTAGSVTGSKAFKTVTSIALPAHDGTGATTAVGFGEKFGLWDKLSHNTVLAAYINETIEGTAATVAVSATAIESNTIDLNSTPDGEKTIDAYYVP